MYVILSSYTLVLRHPVPAPSKRFVVFKFPLIHPHSIDPLFFDHKYDALASIILWHMCWISTISSTWKSSRSCHYFKRFDVEASLFSQRSPLLYFQVIVEGSECGVLLLFQIWIFFEFDINDWSSLFWWHKSIQCIKYTLAYMLDLSSPLLLEIKSSHIVPLLQALWRGSLYLTNGLLYHTFKL
jgi:hypothetical protein